MMATVVRQQTKETSQSTQTAQLFPSVVTSEQTSLNYMKRLTAVAVSNILYLRNVFTEDCYGHRRLDQLKLRILTERCETTGAKQIVQWVKGCFDAMERKYLKQLTFGIYTDPSNPEELIEAYTFRFTYDSNQFNCNISLNKNQNEREVCEQSANQELRLSTVQLLRSLVIMVQSLDRLPEDCFLTMKLLYYDDITPEDYEPPGFMASDNDSFTFKGNPISISAGEVITAYHSLKIKIRTNQKQFQDFASTSSPNTNYSQIESQELVDECTPLSIGGTGNVAKHSTHLEQPTSSRIASNVLSENNSKTQNNSSKKSTKDEPKESIDSNKQSNKELFRSVSVTSGRNSGQKSNENTVISKIKDMRVEDNDTRTHESCKRKLDFEVTQDSLFNSLPNSYKRSKASKTSKTIPIKNRQKI